MWFEKLNLLLEGYAPQRLKTFKNSSQPSEGSQIEHFE